jgi:hypothetical protein
MVELLIVLSVVGILGVASIWADNRFSRHERLPMQWSFGGQVNWTAPRRIALAFTPTIAAVALGGATIAILLSGDPRPGQEGVGPPVLLLVGLTFLTVHALHLWLIDRSVG